MKPLRIVYSVVFLAALGLSFAFYYQNQMKEQELSQYQNLVQTSNQVLKGTAVQLMQKRQELALSQQEVNRLSQTIVSLENDKDGFQRQFQVLKEEREKLQSRMVSLLEEKADLENRYAALGRKFHSVEELKKAIKIALTERSQKYRLARTEMLKALDKTALEQGNRGFLVKLGKSTFRPIKINVELEPVYKWSLRGAETEEK